MKHVRSQRAPRRRSAAIGAALLALAAAAPADAQLYRWRDPETGGVKLSSVPPPWYGRGVSNGPHVDLIVNGKAVDPLAAPQSPSAASGPLPPPRMAIAPPDATREQLVETVLTGLRLSEQLDGWAPAVSAALEPALASANITEAGREELRGVVRASFRRERLQAHFAKAFSVEVTEADLRGVMELEQTPLARRMSALEAARGRQLAAAPAEAAAAEARATPERRILAEAMEQTVQGADLMGASLAGAAAAFALAAPDDMRTRVAELLQRQRAEVQPLLRRTFVRAVLYLYEPLTDAELRALIELQRRPAVARVNRAIALGYAAAVQESLGEFIAGARPLMIAARR